MTQLLERAYAAVAELDASDQDAIATLILEELADERRWQQAFAQSSEALARLAAEALAEHQAGKTQLLNPETL